jgi:hypothetical protein
VPSMTSGGVTRAAQTDVDVARGSRTRQTKLQDDPALRDGAVAEVLEEAREKPVEDEDLAERAMPLEPADARIRCSIAWRNASGLAYCRGGPMAFASLAKRCL